MASATPIRIAGAGPAGLACAIALARAGRDVEVLEALPEVGGRFDGDHQVLPAYGEAPRGDQLLELVGLRRDDLEVVPLRSARFLDGRGRSLEAHSDQPYGLMIRRGPGRRTLEGAMAHAARQAGARLSFGQRASAPDVDVVATGPTGVDGVAMERLFTTGAPDRVDVLFDTRLTPGGYAYLFIHEGEGTLGVAALADYPRLAQILDEAASRFAAREPFHVQNPRQSAHTMNFAVPDTAVREGRLYVGEAGGFQDFLFGLGLRMALMSGTLAAEAILTQTDFDALWKPRLHRRMLLSAVDRFLYEDLPKAGGALLDRVQDHDLQEVLDRLQADGWTKRMLLPWVKHRWLRRRHGHARSRCAHRVGSHYCRRKALPPAVSVALESR